MASPMHLAVGKSKFVNSATGLEVDDGPISRVHEIKTPKVDRVLLRQYHQTREFVTGTLCLTDRHLIFVEPTGAQETWVDPLVLYHHISGVERQSLTTRGYPLVLSCKTFQQLYLIIPRESDIVDIIETIHMFAQPKVYSELYAYQYRPDSSTLKQSSGWSLYEAEFDYKRMGIPNELWQATNLNHSYELCDTYSHDLYVPVCATDDIIMGSAKFRSKGRLPILSYYHSPQQSALCRSSQPLAGLMGRSQEDEEMIQCILKASPNTSTLHVMDTRPRINAMANRAAGKGYEASGYYSNTDYQFYNIHNIHVMRESLQKLIEGQRAHPSPDCVRLSLMSGVLRLAPTYSAHPGGLSLLLQGSSVLVHCSDGWDRTAQTCALTSLFLDPYYHSLHGFMVLIEKEWLSCGHKFSQRCGHTVVEEKETSPIFTQFLDCVWQVAQQFPTSFQFNEHFLVTLHDHAHSCQFGTFIGNCEKERMEQRLSEKTFSLWGHIWDHLDDFINPLYQRGETREVLEPSTDIRHLKLWRGLYGRYFLHDRLMEKEEELMASLHQQNACLHEHILFLSQSVSALKLGLEKLHRRQSCANISSEGVSTATNKTELDDETSTRNNDLGNEGTNPSGTGREDGPSERSSLSPPPFPPSPRRLSPSPTSSAEFRGYLDHLPEMNLPWQPLRSVTRCACGRAFTFLVSKYHCCYCGTVSCNVCASNVAPLPWHATQQPHRVCRPCHKLMKRRLEMEISEAASNT
ncbi:Myotubularin-related protein 6 [Geodia barretti]|uniref:phosphatidylinositol-3,5-bisphosphate 3-phosphatase n=1 Tax=Geodia barretti TaxID=519541 RepID=A0AA35X705_GEOBA|nr:Myotubularin-related protein 6 [Geodia barretti]